MAVAEHAVVVVGGGPTGMMLGAELALAGVDVAIVERNTERDERRSRAGGLHARTIEVLDHRGIADRFLTAGEPAQVAGFSGVRLDISDFPTRHPYGLPLWQSRFEDILAGWLDELGVLIRRGEVMGFAQDPDGVDVELSGGDGLRAEYLVGCDGGRSLIRKAAGIPFPGWDPSVSLLIAEVEMDGDPELGVRQDAKGTHAIGPAGDGDLLRLVVREEEVGLTAEPTLADLSRLLVGVRGTDYGLRGATWISRFTDTTRQAEAYRDRRVLLAGDAAHVHSPMGGQGLNTGVQDAVNLGWKLARVVKGTAPDTLLDTYQAERHPVAARVLKTTMAQTALSRRDDRIDALRDTLAGLLEADDARRQMAGEMSGLDIHYDLGEGHPLLGRRMPDLDLCTADGPARVFGLLHDARPVLIELEEHETFDAPPWAEGARIVAAEYDGPWELPVIGTVEAPAAVLVRPDGYVGWVGAPTASGSTR